MQSRVKTETLSSPIVSRKETKIVRLCDCANIIRRDVGSTVTRVSRHIIDDCSLLVGYQSTIYRVSGDMSRVTKYNVISYSVFQTLLNAPGLLQRIN